MEPSAFPHSPPSESNRRINAQADKESEQAKKGAAFRALHQRGQAFIIPNPWDVGSARLLAHLGFEALASTSAGYAFSAGKPDGAISREQLMTHIADLAAATPLPLSADLQNGFGDAPEAAAETIILAASAGAVGGSIEDSKSEVSIGAADNPVYELEDAAERIRAAVEASRALPFSFTLTARAENYIVGRPDLKDTIRRLQAFQEAGADVLYAPGLSSPEEIAAVISSVDHPVNVLAGIATMQLTLKGLSALGVKRVSVGSGLARAALGAFLRAAHEMQDGGTFTFAQDAASSGELNASFNA